MSKHNGRLDRLEQMAGKSKQGKGKLRHTYIMRQELDGTYTHEATGKCYTNLDDLKQYDPEKEVQPLIVIIPQHPSDALDNLDRR